MTTPAHQNRQCAPHEMRISFELETQTGDCADPSEGQIDHLMELPFAEQLVTNMGGHFLIFHLSLQDYSDGWTEATRQQICEILNGSAL